MINAKATDRVLTTIQAWAGKFVPTASERARDTALLALLEDLQGLGEGNTSYEDTVKNLHKLLELRMNPPVLTVEPYRAGDAAPSGIIVDALKKLSKTHVEPGAIVRRKVRERCPVLRILWDGVTGEEVRMQCGRDKDHEGKHNSTFAWEDADVKVDVPAEVAQIAIEMD